MILYITDDVTVHVFLLVEGFVGLVRHYEECLDRSWLLERCGGFARSMSVISFVQLYVRNRFSFDRWFRRKLTYAAVSL